MLWQLLPLLAATICSHICAQYPFVKTAEINFYICNLLFLLVTFIFFLSEFSPACNRNFLFSFDYFLSFFFHRLVFYFAVAFNAYFHMSFDIAFAGFRFALCFDFCNFFLNILFLLFSTTISHLQDSGSCTCCSYGCKYV